MCAEELEASLEATYAEVQQSDATFKVIMGESPIQHLYLDAYALWE